MRDWGASARRVRERAADWIKNVFERLTDIFRKEIAEYSETVEMYLTEKNQDLHVPERIFFHLVENKMTVNFPLHFWRLTPPEERDGRVRHVPLQYALTEYKGQREKLLELLSCLNKAEVRDMSGTAR